MVPVVIYTTPWCPFCISARRLLESKNVPYKDVDVSRDPGLRAKMEALSGRTSVPQVWIGEDHIGGCDELYSLDRSGQLDIKLGIGG